MPSKKTKKPFVTVTDQAPVSAEALPHPRTTTDMGENVEHSPDICQGTATMSLDYNQRMYDKFLLVKWKEGKTTCFIANTQYLQRMGISCVETTNEGVGIELKRMGIHRRPPDSFGYCSLGMWMAAAYPQFIDKVAATKDANTIDLSSLTFVANPKPPQMSYRPKADKIRREETRGILCGDGTTNARDSRRKLRGH